MGYGLGVDLGTSFTGVAIGRYGRTRIVPLSDDPISASSLTAIRPAGALRLHETDDTVPVVLGGRSYPPVAVLAEALRSVLDSVTASEGEQPEQVVLTCPAVWGPARRQQFGEVSRRAGLASVTVVSEPEAAVTALVDGRRLAEDDVVVVYDLGGVTADMTVVRVTESGMEILGLPEGADGAGGADFDDLVLAHVDRAVGGALSGLDLSDPVAVGVLAGVRAECVRAKEALSRIEVATVRVVGLAEQVPPVRLMRAEFEAMIRGPIRSTLSGLHRVLDSAGVEAKDLTAVVLVGGSSRIPSVSRMLADTLGRPVLVDEHPQHCVALGAAAIAAGTSTNADGALLITPGAPPITDSLPTITASALIAAANATGTPLAPPITRAPGPGGPPTPPTGPVRFGPVRHDPVPTPAQTMPALSANGPHSSVGSTVGQSITVTPPAAIDFPGSGRADTGPVDISAPGLFRRAGGHRMPRMGDWRRRAGSERHGVEDRHWRVVATAVATALLIATAAYAFVPVFIDNQSSTGAGTQIVSPGSGASDAPEPTSDLSGRTTPPSRRTPPSRSFVPTGNETSGPLIGLSGKCLDVVDGVDTNGARVQLLRCLDSPAQDWSAPGDGTLRSQGKCLHIIDVGFFDPRLEINACSGAADQQWAFDQGMIRNPASGECLSVLGANPANGTPIITDICIDGPGQRWKMRT